jgi:hypothetical protein
LKIITNNSLLIIKSMYNNYIKQANLTNGDNKMNRSAIIKALKNNTIFSNHYNNVYIPHNNTNLCLGKVASLSVDKLQSALNKGGFIC